MELRDLPAIVVIVFAIYGAIWMPIDIIKYLRK